MKDHINTKKGNRLDGQGGHVLISVIVLLGLALLVGAGVLSSASSNAKTRAIVTTQANYYYDVEETLNRVVGWLQANSQNLVGAFSSTNFTTNFDLGSPALGSNEGQHFGVPTMVKMKNTNNSVMLSNNSFFGTASFPSTNNIVTNASFDAVTSFQNADLGGANARIILVWARQTAGNYEPIFRVDVVTGNNPDRGVHSFSYVYSTLVATGGGPGFYGKNDLILTTPNNDCYSYLYTYSGGTWSRGAPRSNCSVNSDAGIDISSKVYGTANSLTNNGITFSPPGGDASGGTCDGPGCHSLALPVVNSWSGYCPGGGSDMTISSNTTLSAGGCYRDLLINNNRTLTLTDTATPYYFRNIRYGGNNAQIRYGNPGIAYGQKIRLYAEQYDANGNNHINGNKMYNQNNAPHQVEMYYLGSSALTLNGNVTMNAVIFAPLTTVNVLGNFNFYGSIQALELDVSGNARINYDETLGATPVLSDVNFSLKKTSQRYR